MENEINKPDCPLIGQVLFDKQNKTNTYDKDIDINKEK